MSKILIADDNKQITSVLTEYAKKEGYTVEVATDGVEAMEKYKSFEPDLILLDVMMPRMDGFEVCRDIRRESNVPIIMVTARGEDFEKILSAGRRRLLRRCLPPPPGGGCRPWRTGCTPSRRSRLSCPWHRRLPGECGR